MQMIDYTGKEWTRSAEGERIDCADGRSIGVNAEWTDQQCMDAVKFLDDARTAEAEQTQADNTERGKARADATIRYLVNHTAEQIEQYVADNVTNLATAKTVIAKLAVAVAALARRELR